MKNRMKKMSLRAKLTTQPRKAITKTRKKLKIRRDKIDKKN